MSSPVATVKDLTDYLADLRRSRNFRYGSLGEAIYKSVMQLQGRSVEPLHKDGADFCLDGKERVDVKTRLCLGHASGQRIRQLSPSQMPSKKTTYSYIMMYDDAVQVHVARPGAAIELVAELPWGQVLKIHNQKHARGVPSAPNHVSKDEEARQAAKADLIGWVAEHWRMKAKVVLRSTRITQEKMGRSGWGPEAFYHDPKRRRGVELVVLLYFDHDTVYEVFAYPMPHSHNIKWRDKTVGPNPGRRKTFDPSALPELYKFADIEAFKQEFVQRFGLKS